MMFKISEFGLEIAWAESKLLLPQWFKPNYYYYFARMVRTELGSSTYEPHWPIIERPESPEFETYNAN